jgi:dTDP-4-amino-4,6-dideoxygalactose transaminase
MHLIPFNKPFLVGSEIEYIREAILSGKLSGNGKFTKMSQNWFEKELQINKALLTTSCTDALEMAAILLDIQPGDEVILPSYTFVSTANAFALRGAKLVFADSRADHPGIDEQSLESLITSKTKAIVPVHYAGVACDMDVISSLALRHNLNVVEDAAQAIDSYFHSKNGDKLPLGSIGNLAAFSFHETKNIISGEGGLLAIKDDQFSARAEIIWEKGTNRSSFFRGEVDKYGWVDIGSSFLPSELNAAFLYAQLENIEKIQNKRKNIWNTYEAFFSSMNFDGVRLPFIPDFATNNAHMFYIILSDVKLREELMNYLKGKGIMGVFHYQSLHKSKYFETKHDGRDLPFTDQYTDCLLRLPLFYDLTENEQAYILDQIKLFFKK